MRIISGTYKGKRLIAPKNLPVRPTTDFAKEALFNILRNKISFDEISLLDLYAGTGNISYEFASRGTQDITAVDTHYGCLKYISRIADELSLSIKTIKSDVQKFLSSVSASYDVIFADPPYDVEVRTLKKIIENIFQNNLIKPKGFLIIEHSKHKDLSEALHFSEARKYGGSVFSFFELE